MDFSGVTNMYYGGSGVTEAWYGGVKVWPTSIDYSSMYLTFDILTGGTIVWKESGGTVHREIQYSINNGAWTTLNSSNATSVNVNAGDNVRLKGLNQCYSTDKTNLCYFGGGTASFNVYGNIMSLIYGDNYRGQTIVYSGYTFNRLFSTSKAINADNLVLPITNPMDRAYRHLFSYCTSLKSAKFELPIRDLTGGVAIYGGMFEGSTALEEGPELPATVLDDSCYSDMFSRCSSLKKAPNLPATALTSGCYNAMFLQNTSLVTAPELPATTLVSNCYYRMFDGCSKLNYIKCLAHPFNTSYQGTWVRNVSSTGTFVKSPSLTSYTRGNNGIPTNWTVVDAT